MVYYWWKVLIRQTVEDHSSGIITQKSHKTCISQLLSENGQDQSP